MEEKLSALEKAISMARSGIEATSLDGYNSRMACATAYAAIAQAEQLERIADYLERLVATTEESNS